jgi:acetamidase/formamidase
VQEAHRTLHDLRADAYAYVWDNSLEPALEIEPGEHVGFHIRDASDEQITARSDASAIAKLDFTHVNPVSGPVFVKGAHPGDVLEVELVELAPRDGWGWTAIIPGFGLLQEDYPEPWLRISEVDRGRSRVVWSDGITLPYRPFPGTIGVAPAEAGEHPVLPPSRWGGNIDTKHLRAGARLWLPVGVEGALFSIGDTHATQGDGEVCGTAIESAMDVVLRFSVRDDVRIETPHYELPAGALAATEPGAYHVTTGVGPDLLEASKQAVRQAIEYLGERHSLDPEEAYALCSVAADLRIHEVVDAPNWVVGLFVPQEIFEKGER